MNDSLFKYIKDVLIEPFCKLDFHIFSEYLGYKLQLLLIWNISLNTIW